MKRIFIAYADEKMAYSLKRIGRLAVKTGVFDEVLLWAPEDLPDYVKHSKLMEYSYGGGYWAWKPVIIFETLQRYDDETVICYVDAGCTLRPHQEWEELFGLMKDNDFLCFCYKDIMPEWERFGSTSSRIKHWVKKEALHYLDNHVGSTEWHEMNKVLGGILFVKGTENKLIKDWLDISLNHPEIILDPDINKLDEEYEFFAQHKHDQPVLTALAYKYKENVAVMQERFEDPKYIGAISASRVRARTYWDYLKLRSKAIIRALMGDKLLYFLRRKK
jgi:hypothetical protein